MTATTKTKAAGLDTRAALETTLPANHIPLSDLVQHNITGQRLAQDFLFELRQEPSLDGDALFIEISNIAPSADLEQRVILRGFARVLQKLLERRNS
jgi:hypothetical protein